MTSLNVAEPLILDDLAKDRRRYRRVAYRAPAQCLSARGEEFSAMTVDLAAGGVAIAATHTMDLGEELVIYIAGIGRLAGRIARAIDKGYALSTSLVPHKREKIADQLTWLVNKDRLKLEEDRKSIRRNAAGSVRVSYDGVISQCDVIDVSVLGIALKTQGPRPPIGAEIVVGQNAGVCARYMDNGFAVEFRNARS
ncbi:MAG: PilZ domain-containing protein [Pseudomonadota bacterium]